MVNCTPTGRLLVKIEAYLIKHGLSARDFGECAVNDTKLVYSMRLGRELRFATMRKIEEFMR